MTRKLALPDNVHQFESRKAGTFRIDALKVALHGRSYREAATFDNLVASYPAPVAGWLNIGVLHTGLEGYAAHARYAPCSLAELTAQGYDYWALGHVHEPAILHRQPWVVFPGNLQGRHIRETGERGAMLVMADESGIRGVERLPVDVLRWERLAVDATDDATLDAVVRRVGRAFEQLIAKAPENPYLCVRVILTGQTAAHGEMFGLATHLREEILGQATGLGIDRLWVEKVRIETQPVHDLAQLTARADAIADLLGFLQEAPGDATLLNALLDDLRPLVDKAPRELITAIPDLEALRNGDAAHIINAVIPDLLAHLADSTPTP